jgi:hypothetical protein
MGGLIMRDIARCFLHFYAAWRFPNLNPRLKSHAMTLRAAFFFNRK